MIKQRYLDTFYLLVALLTYAFFSSSTPDNVGVPEIVIALFLLLFVGLKTPLITLQKTREKTTYLPQYLYIVFYVLLIVPLFIGIVVNENNILDALRDIIPFIYLFIPLFFIEKMNNSPEYWSDVLLILISVIGVSFSMRHLLTSDNPFESIGKEIIFGNKEYFPMDPAVLFTATILPLIGIFKVFIEKKIFFGTLFIFFGFLTFLSIVSIMVRAQIILVLFSIIIYFLWISKQNFFRLLTIGLIVFILITVNIELLSGIYDLLMAKFENAGLSNRDAEFIAVVHNSSLSFMKTLFGEGWGGMIELPTSPGSKIRFTHNIFNYFILKGGFIGVALIGSYFMYIILLLMKLKWNNRNIILNLTLINIIIVHILLEPGFKMLSIGLIILYFILYIKSKSNPIKNSLNQS